MKYSEGFQPIHNSLSELPHWISDRILQQIKQLTCYEPVIGIMGKTGAGKSSLCNALFAGDISPVSDVVACTRDPLRFSLQVGERVMTLVDLPGVGKVAYAMLNTLHCITNSFPNWTWCCGWLKPMIERWRWMNIFTGR